MYRKLMEIHVNRSPSDITRRLDRLIADIRSRFHEPAISFSPVDSREKAPCGDVLLVAHGHILRAFAMRWIGRELTQGVSLLLEGMVALSLSLSYPLNQDAIRKPKKQGTRAD